MGKKQNMNDMLDFIREYVGDVGAEVFKALVKANKEVLDTELKDMIDLEEQDVRRSLYELHNLGLVNYRRMRNTEDNKYIYYWKIDSSRINHVLLQRKKAVLKKLKDRLQYEMNNTFYVCPVDGVRLTFEEAMEKDFRCPRCGEMLVFEDNQHIKEQLKQLIRKLEEEIINEEKKLGH